MSREQHDDDCPSCRPALLDLQTGHALPMTDPIMHRVMHVWRQTELAERQAFHRVTCLNSRAPDDLRVMAALSRRIQLAIEPPGSNIT